MKNIIQCLLLAVGCAAMPLAAAPTTPVVIGTDLRITQGELDKAYETYVLTQLAFAGVEVSPVFEKSIRKALLDDLIMNRLTAQRADATDLSKADLKATENYKDQRANWPTDLAFELVVDATGLTMVEF